MTENFYLNFILTKTKSKKKKTLKMKRRWSNNGGFALRILEESSSEVTSSSAGLVLGPGGLTMSPSPLESDYGELELWYDDAAYNPHSVIASAVQGCTAVQTTIIPLPSMNNALSHTPRSTSANSISSGKFIETKSTSF